MGINPVRIQSVQIYLYFSIIMFEMTHQDFNHIFYQFTGSKKGIKPSDKLTTTGKELKEFVEFSIKKLAILDTTS